MKIPFTNNPSETFTIEIYGIVYQIRQLWNTIGFWTIDIGEVDGTCLVAGVKIVAKTRLLEQYPELPFELESTTETDPGRDDLSEFVLVVTEKNG